MDLRSPPLVLIGAAVATLVVAGPAAAASSVTSGWWTSSPVALAPDVGDGQLLVQGGGSVEDPGAYAGMSFVLDDDEEPSTLTLAVAPESASTPAAALSLCALDAPATEAAGEPADGAPAPDCATSVEAQPSADGTAYSFDVSAFATDGSLDVAVVPGQPSDRVVFEAPTVASLRSTAPINPIGSGFDSGGSSTPAPPSSPPSISRGAATTGSSSGSFTAPRTAPSVSVPPAPASIAAGGPADTGGGDAGDVVGEQEVAAPATATPFEPAASTSTSSAGGVGAGLLLAGLAAAAATLWMRAGNGSEQSASDAPVVA